LPAAGKKSLTSDVRRNSMKTTTMLLVFMAAVVGSICNAQDQSEMDQMQRHAKVMKCLFSVIPLTITNPTPYKAALDRVVKSVQGRDWNQTTDALTATPASLADVSRLLHDLVRVPTVAHIEYNGYYIVSDLLPIKDDKNLPVDSEVDLKIRLIQLALENPETFMSGFIIPKGSSKWLKYDFTRTYTLTPKGVKIEKTISAEPAGGAYVSPAAGDPSAHP
jgi:hypothetical protein